VLLQQRADFEVDVEKLEKLIASLGAHKETLAKKITERETDLAAKRKEMGLLEKVRGLGSDCRCRRRGARNGQIRVPVLLTALIFGGRCQESEGIRKRVQAQSISKEDIIRMNTDR
jgi:hypothetical protein